LGHSFLAKHFPLLLGGVEGWKGWVGRTNLGGIEGGWRVVRHGGGVDVGNLR